MESTIPENTLTNWKKRFFTIWTGQAFSQIGSRLVGFAFVWHLTTTTGSATVLAIASLMSILPDVIISPIAGVLIDRWNRRTVLIVTDLLTALLTLILALLFAFTNVQLWQIYIVLFIRAIFGAFQWPAMLTSTSMMVPKDQLSRVSGMNQTMSGVMGILAPPLGAFLVALIPMWGVLMVDVGTALIAVIPLFFFKIPQPQRKVDEVNPDAKVKITLWKDLVEGFKYVITLPGLLAIILTAMLINFLLGPAFNLMPILVTEYFQKGVIELGVGEAIFSIGFLAGGLILSIWGGFKNRLFTTMFFMIIMGISIALVGFVPPNSFYLAMSMLGIAGIANPLVDGPLMAAMQSRVDPTKQGRVFTLLHSGASLAMPIGLAIAGPLSDKVGIQIWFIAGGVACIIAAILSLLNKNVMGLGLVPEITEVEPTLAVSEA
ncbi:MAG: MFS transporter [Anaerolineaceae bacterium]|nr:MFS transporter [Anaerolineaceae bacterium]